MRHLLTLLTAALLLAQAPQVPAGSAAIRTERLRADLTFLSSDALEGRRSLQRGSEVAIQWIASEFAKAGLKPAAGDSFLQTVPLIEFQPDRELTSLVVRRGGQSETWRAPDAAASFPDEGTFSGGVVFAGFGITAPELNYDDYAGIDARGKVVLVFSHEPQEADAGSVFNGRGNTRYANANYKAFNARRHGAVAVLAAPDPNHPAAPAAARARTGQGRAAAVSQSSRITPQALAEGGPGIPVFTISERVSESLFRAAGKSAAEVQSGIDARPAPGSFEIPGTSVELRTAHSERRRGNSWNVAGVLEGSDPSLRAETIVFSAHYDHLGIGPAGVYPGADDNGSGTAGVVELARAYAEGARKPKRSLLFIVFAGEERGLLGAYYYVSHPLRPLLTTRAVINFDMIGRNEGPTGNPAQDTGISPDTTNELGLLGTHYSPDYRAAVERANRTVGLKLNYKWDLDSAQQILFRSDQYPFLLRDIPSVWWFTGFHPDYHQVTDTVDKINFVKLTKILQLAWLTGFEFANGEQPRLEPRARSY
jgi:hypothetical protein